ncbi:MAG: hypothetical protein V1889_03890 [archaeon]
MFGLFGHRKRINELKLEIRDSFDYVKKDFNKVGEWIRHLDDKHGSYENEIAEIKNQILAIQDDLMGLKDFVSFFSSQWPRGLFKQSRTDEVKQTMGGGAQSLVQTPVQTNILNNLTIMERAIVWTLLNSEMKLSYEDLATLLGKDKSTIRGQINTIRQKNNDVILETREINGKKRVYIPDNIKFSLIKGLKIKINKKIEK